MANEKPVHALSDNLTSHSSSKMEISIPQLDIGLHFEPSQTDEQAKDHAALVVLTTGPSGCFDHILGNNAAVGVDQDLFIDLAGNNLFNLIFQS